MSENIYYAILLAAIATYLCRVFGLLFSKKIDINSSFFTLIEYISMGIIISVIAKIIFYPEGILGQTTLEARITTIFFLLIIYFLTKKNILFSLISSNKNYLIWKYNNAFRKRKNNSE